MSRWQDEPRDAHERITIRKIWLTLALSLLIHTGALLVLIPHLTTSGIGPEEPSISSPVQVQLVPQGSPTPPVAAAAPDRPRETQAVITPPVRPPKVVQRTPPRQAMTAPSPAPAPAIVEAPPAPVTPPAPPSPPVAAATPPAPATGDLASFIESRRRARGETASEDTSDDYKRNLAANLPRGATGTASQPKNGGGIFEIKRMAYDDAVFEFYGWNRDVGRRTPQVFEVRKGNNADMRIAVIRRMIAIIRDYEKEEFVWESKRLGRNVTLSAKQADNAALEEFMMHEFFDGGRSY